MTLVVGSVRTRRRAGNPDARPDRAVAAVVGVRRHRLALHLGDTAAAADLVAQVGALTTGRYLGARLERACTLLLLPQGVEEGRAELAVLGAASR